MANQSQLRGLFQPACVCVCALMIASVLQGRKLDRCAGNTEKLSEVQGRASSLRGTENPNPTPPTPALPRPVLLLPVYQRLCLRVRQMYKWYKQYQTLIRVINQGRYVYIGFLHPSKAADTEVRVIRLAELVEKSSGQNLQMDGWISKGRRDQRKRGGRRYLSKPCPMQMKTHWMKDTKTLPEREREHVKYHLCATAVHKDDEDATQWKLISLQLTQWQIALKRVLHCLYICS